MVALHTAKTLQTEKPVHHGTLFLIFNSLYSQLLVIPWYTVLLFHQTCVRLHSQLSYSFSCFQSWIKILLFHLNHSTPRKTLSFPQPNKIIA